MWPLILGFMVAVLTITANGAIAQTSSGTAFAVARHLLVTNQHVVAGCSSIEVVSADGRRTASVVDANDQIDLALLRVIGIKGATARLRNPRNVRLGESVMVFGYPLAGSLTSGGNFTSGLVSGLRGLRDAAGEIQITAPVQPGNSGGPLLDRSGLVIGVVEAKLDALRTARLTGDIPQNVNFAISLEVLVDFLAENNVAFRNGAVSKPLDTARVAEIAQTFTHRVECRGRSQQAKASPEVGERTASPEKGQGRPTYQNRADRRSDAARASDSDIEEAAHRAIETCGPSCSLRGIFYNQMVLIAGDVPSNAWREQIEDAIRGIPKVRGVFNQVRIGQASSKADRDLDRIIESRVKTRLASANVSGRTEAVIVAERRVVYLMGLIRRAEAHEITEITRTTAGVLRVVRAFEYVD